MAATGAFHSVLEEDPWKAVRPSRILDWTARGRRRRKWKWTAAKPRDWTPRVRVEPERVTVTFYSYSGLETQTIFRHTDIYRPGNYRREPNSRQSVQAIPASCLDPRRVGLASLSDRR